MKKYQINLFYGFEECEDGIYHSFRAEDPDVQTNVDDVERELAECLDCKPGDDAFNFNCMYIDLPDSVVKKIEADFLEEIREALEREHKENF